MLVDKIQSIASRPNQFMKESSVSPDQHLENVKTVRKMESARIAEENLRIHKRLQQIKPSKDVDKKRHEHDFAKSREVVSLRVRDNGQKKEKERQPWVE